MVSKTVLASRSMTTVIPLEEGMLGRPRLTGIVLTTAPSLTTVISFGDALSSIVMISERPMLHLRVESRLP